MSDDDDGPPDMPTYGGFGGVTGGRPLNPDDAFEMACVRQFGQRIAEERVRSGFLREPPYTLGEQLWAALANCSWKHDNGETAGYTWRAAGDLVAAIHGASDYMQWYMCIPDGVISDDIAEGLADEGWHGTSLTVDIASLDVAPKKAE